MPSSHGPIYDNRDHAAGLPPQSEKIYDRLRELDADARAIGSRLENEKTVLHSEKIDAEARGKLFTRPLAYGGRGIADNDARVVEIEVELADIEVRRAKLAKHAARTEPRAAALSSVMQRCEQYLRDHRGEFCAVEIDIPALKRGQTVIDLIEQRRHRLRELAADAHRDRSVPLPAALAKARVREQIDAIAERGRVGVEAVVENDYEVEWPMAQRFALVANTDQPGAVAQWEEVDVLAAFAWLHRDALVKRLSAEIDAIADDKVALSPEQKVERLTAIDKDRLAVEREEAAIIWQAIDAGSSVMFRADTDVRAVLGVA